MDYTTNIGDYLVIQIVGMIDSYIAEVTSSSPLIVKVEESGPFAKLKSGGDFIVMEFDTLALQKDVRDDTCFWLQKKVYEARPPLSGLFSLNVTDGQLHTILPAP